MKKVKWGVIGTAMIANFSTIPAMKMANNCELYAIAGRSLEKANAFKEKHGFAVAYGSYDELLADKEVEAVYIALPNDMHKEWTIKAAKAGKHILCEKPLGVSADEVREMVEVCRRENVFLMEAFAFLHSPLIKEVQDIIASGEIGDVRFIETTFLTPGLQEGNIRGRRETYGGSLYDLGCYNTSLARQLIGKVPNKVVASAFYTENNIDLCLNGLMEFDDGVRVSYLSGMCAGARGDRFFVYGTKATIEVLVPFNGEGEQTLCVRSRESKREIKLDIPNNYMLEVEQLGRCITDGETPFVTNELSIDVAIINDMTLQSAGYFDFE